VLPLLSLARMAYDTPDAIAACIRAETRRDNLASILLFQLEDAMPARRSAALVMNCRRTIAANKRDARDQFSWVETRNLLRLLLLLLLLLLGMMSVTERSVVRARIRYPAYQVQAITGPVWNVIGSIFWQWSRVFRWMRFLFFVPSLFCFKWFASPLRNVMFHACRPRAKVFSAPIVLIFPLYEIQ